MASSLLIFQTVKYNQNQGNILTNGGGKKCLKLHKYTLKLYKYAVLRGLLLGEERNAI